MHLFKVFIQPHHEYAMVLYSPFLLRDSQALESVQNRVMNSVKGFRLVPCEAALQRLCLFSIASRKIKLAITS